MAKKVSDFLAKASKGAAPPVIVVFGDEDFLRREAMIACRRWVVGDDASDFTLSEHRGDTASLAEVLDELRTPPFLGETRLVIVEDADKFVTEHRGALERYVDAPSPCGVLLLIVSTFPSNTRLYKSVDAKGLAIDAAAPKAWHVPAWCVRWAQERYGKSLDGAAAEWLVELAGTSLGQLDQALAKLAGYLGEETTIDAALVDQLVAGTRTETAFKLLDMVLEGQLAKAMELLDRQFISGESPVAVLAMLSSQLKRLGRAAREVELGASTAEALKSVGIPPFAVDKARAQMNHFGKQRMRGMLRRLLEADLGIKGSSGLSQRGVVEQLIVELAM